VVDTARTCCLGPIDSVTGTCCGADSRFIDGRGRCCLTGNVDACGICGGTGVAVDAKGVCCATALDTSGLCCTASIDDCGVCSGVNSCFVSVTVNDLPRSGGFNFSKTAVASAFGVPVSSVGAVQLGVTSASSGSSRRLSETVRDLPVCVVLDKNGSVLCLIGWSCVAVSLLLVSELPVSDPTT
jgi:hypothetical protein